jgi:hypothetical protein
MTPLIASVPLLFGLTRGLQRAVIDDDPVPLGGDDGTAIALGGDCLADVAAVRSQPEVFGTVASDPTVSQVFAALAVDIDEAVAAIRGVRAQARTPVWMRRRPTNTGEE